MIYMLLLSCMDISPAWCLVKTGKSRGENGVYLWNVGFFLISFIFVALLASMLFVLLLFYILPLSLSRI